MMKVRKLTHIDKSGNPAMVDVSGKEISRRQAKAQAVVLIGKEIAKLVVGDDIQTKKGSVLQTAIIAGIAGAKQTAMLIPLSHAIGMDDCQLSIKAKEDRIIITSSVTVRARTGVEMEALTAVSIAALTVYDMLKALSHEITITDIKLLEKTGGKKDYKRNV